MSDNEIVTITRAEFKSALDQTKHETAKFVATTLLNSLIGSLRNVKVDASNSMDESTRKACTDSLQAFLDGFTLELEKLANEYSRDGIKGI